MGPITKRLGEFYNRVVAAKEPRYRDWITPVYHSSRVSP
jgi:hypothetical protein